MQRTKRENERKIERERERERERESEGERQRERGRWKRGEAGGVVELAELPTQFAIEQRSHMQDSHGQILALAFR